jgi:hypothetical protein
MCVAQLCSWCNYLNVHRDRKQIPQRAHARKAYALCFGAIWYTNTHNKNHSRRLPRMPLITKKAFTFEEFLTRRPRALRSALYRKNLLNHTHTPLAAMLRHWSLLIVSCQCCVLFSRRRGFYVYPPHLDSGGLLLRNLCQYLSLIFKCSYAYYWVAYSVYVCCAGYKQMERSARTWQRTAVLLIV